MFVKENMKPWRPSLPISENFNAITNSPAEYFKAIVFNVGAFLAPCIVSLGLFLGLFNNWDRGGPIIAVIVCANAAFILFSFSLQINHPCCIAREAGLILYRNRALPAGPAVEALFPRVLPGEYAQILNLSQNLLASPLDRRSDYDVVFNNEIQDAPTAVPAVAAKSPIAVPISWHKPAAPFAYYGRDPNTGMRYLNSFTWNSRGYYDIERVIRKHQGTFIAL